MIKYGKFSVLQNKYGGELEEKTWDHFGAQQRQGGLIRNDRRKSRTCEREVDRTARDSVYHVDPESVSGTLSVRPELCTVEEILHGGAMFQLCQPIRCLTPHTAVV